MKAMQRAKKLFGALDSAVIKVAAMATVAMVPAIDAIGAQSLNQAVGNMNSSKTIDQATDSFAGYIWAAAIIVFMLIGATGIGMGIMKWMNKDQNQREAEGWWKWIVGGACCLGLTAIVAILKNTTTQSFQ